MTAVEWVFEELENKENGFPHLTLEQIYKQAKEMEKQQIINACESTDSTDFWVKYESYEQYYNEQFKNK